MNLRKILAAVSFIFLVSYVFAEKDINDDCLKITIDDAVFLAKKNNITVKVAENTLKNLDIKNKYSWNSLSPSASLSASYADDLENNSNTLALSGSVNLSLKTNLYSDINGAKINYEKGLVSYEETVRSIELSVRKTFYNLIYQQENLLLQKRNLETSREQYENNQEKFRNGKISELDAFTSRVNYQSKKPVVESAEINFQNDLASFKQILGIDQNKKLELDGSLDSVLNLREISLEALPDTEKAAPEIQLAEYNLKIAENALLDSRFSAYGPNITGSYTYGKSKNSELDDWKTTNQISVGLSIPLDGAMPWSSKGVNVSVNKNALDTAEQNLKDAKISVAVKTESYIRKINQAVKQLDSLKETHELAQETYQMSKTAYNYGKTDLLTLQTASDSVLSAGVSLKNQAYVLISSILDLENVLGLEFGTLGKEGK